MWPSTLYEGQEALGVLVEFLHSEDVGEGTRRGHVRLTCVYGRPVGYPHIRVTQPRSLALARASFMRCSNEDRWKAQAFQFLGKNRHHDSLT